ncbi:uncharacterized protein involved in formation of periplasmic nitrate reductase [Beggiatoa alba B18LD]|uniref:Chaperone NapD n=1 Tax=Beggiatoa alba B18LD TaxID=395493 RepID=I3CHX4_9GAMM|nr:chaperone NapD [Beggiatoa alba]EIJ43217.1 uncharacterized protein involved in formation of periplasmic nitrate reductase [Beggiatoa alba B18LD]
MNIAGVIVHASPRYKTQVRESLQTLQGVEVHFETPDGRFIVTIEEEEQAIVADTIMNLHKLDGVLSAAMVYQHSEPDEEVENEK